MRRRAATLLAGFLLGSCGSGQVLVGEADTGTFQDAGPSVDAGAADAGALSPDAGELPADAGGAPDVDGGLTGSDAGPGDASCPPPSPTAIEATLDWGQVLQHRMASEVVASFPVVAPLSGQASVVFTQGQQPSTPADVVTEFYVSRCRGLIVPPAAGSRDPCYYRSIFVNNNHIVLYTRPVFGWDSQATLGDNGCWAPASEGAWFVNVRWTYPTCPFSGCGFSLQWSQGPW